MSEILTVEHFGRRQAPRAGGKPHLGAADFFNRNELDQILQVYSRKVMAGEWLDYALGHGDAGAMFAIYGRVSAIPLYCIWKRPKSYRKVGRYQVSVRDRVLKTDTSLAGILKLLERRPPRLVATR